MTLPGWYPDPDDPSARRYFDGQAWSAPLAAGPTKPAPAPRRRRLWVVVTAAAVVVAAGVLTVVLVVNRGAAPKSLSYRFGYDAGKDLATGNAVQVLLGNQDLGSPADVRRACSVQLSELAGVEAISDASKTIKVKDIVASDYVDGCVKGVQDKFGDA